MNIFDDQLIQITKSPPHLNTWVQAKVLSVYDGDTITVVYNINNNINCPFIINVRLTGIDAPEKKTSNILEKQASILVTKFVSDLLINTIVGLLIEGWDKYGGRINGTIKLSNNQNLHHSDKENDQEYIQEHGQEQILNDILLEKGLVKKFDGKTSKELWSNEELNAIISRLTI